MHYPELQQNNMEKAESSRDYLYDSSENSYEPNCTKLFSMRQYVLLSRQQDIFRNWPFAEKYLRMCLKTGVTNVLPPLNIQFKSLVHDDLKQEEGNPSNARYPDNKNVNNIVRKGKKSRNWKRKMKSMEEIFATAKHCTLELDEMNESCTTKFSLG